MLPAMFYHIAICMLFCGFNFIVSSCHQIDNLNILKENANQVTSSSNFLFGTASSSYQFEGAFHSDGKGLNNWDVFTHEAGHIKDGSNGDVAVDHYNRYLEDVKLMEDMGVNSYRFSISWARILPKGAFGDVNMAGIEHYNKLIDALLQKGIQPFITLTHYDIPQELEERYGGWLSSRIQDDFSYYADICFKYFGDRVKYWTTINEPHVMAVYGYRLGSYPPARCSGIFGNCSAGDSEREPFIAAHNMILSHAAAVRIYRTKHQKRQGGMVGIALDIQWYEPFSNSSEDIAATERARSFYFNWFLDPIILGRYPKEMVQILGSNLPNFSKNDLSKLSYGLDFIGINYYTANYIKDCLYSACEHGNTWSEGSYYVTTEKDGVYIGQPTGAPWIFLYPQGMKKIVMYMRDRFNNTPLVITENGVAENDDLNTSITDTLNDIHRVNYMHSYLNSLSNAIREGADVRGYFVWSLLDNFEWLHGYRLRFGLHYVNYTNLQRIPKLSATMYKQLMYNFNIQLETHTALNYHHVIKRTTLISSSNFLFGTASSCYQYEGAILSDGKGLNNWDVFTHEAGHIKDGSNGDVAVDHYNRYLEDVKLMEDMGVNSYRFSISWARILPKGTFGDVNMAGIEHYNKLIDVLLQKGIQPFITLTHYDIPQELEERYGGWLSSRIQDDFSYYADICFKYFGDRVKYWTTINEPNVMAVYGYRLGSYPPARCSGIFGKCSAGDSEREPFIAAHNMILSHAAAVRIYRTRYQKRQGGMIGIALDIQWYEPFSNSSEDIAATERARSFYVNWFLDPIILGRYPKEMVQILGSNLPDFSKNDLSKLSYGLDFIGINYYTANYIKDCLYSACEHGNTWSEGSYFATIEKDGVFIGQPTGVEWLFLYPQGMKKIVMYMKDKFNNTPMVITENGIAENDNLNPSITDTLNDIHRVNYMHSYLNSLANAIREGADVRGYFVWSLLDNFEWLDGYKLRFGLHFVNYTNLQRTPKLSATRYKQLMYNFIIQLETHTAQN